MHFVIGDFTRLSSVVATQAKQWLDTGTGKPVDVTSPDNVLLNGTLVNGAVASVCTSAPSRSPEVAIAWRFMAARER